jgi:DNA-binding transcriptional regulator GbsR (MarR family)
MSNLANDLYGKKATIDPRKKRYKMIQNLIPEDLCERHAVETHEERTNTIKKEKLFAKYSNKQSQML